MPEIIMKRKDFVALAVMAPLIFIIGLFLSGYLKTETVLSGSMSPAFNRGDIIVISRISPDDVKVNDIVTFRTGKSLTTHRVISIGNSSFLTKGDANGDPDPSPIPADSVIGKMIFVIPFYGYIGNFVRTPFGFLLMVVLPGALIIVFELRKILKCRKKGRDSFRKRPYKVKIIKVRFEQPPRS
jgi:signal peptidase I